MKYPDGKEIRIGDRVIADGALGTVVVDFDNKEHLPSFEGFEPHVPLNGGGLLSFGIMINTDELGLLYYYEQDGGVLWYETSEDPKRA